MFRARLSGARALFVGVVFFVLVVGGSLLYRWHVHRTTDAEVAETQRKVQLIENMNKTRTAEDTVDISTVDFEHAETNLETDDAQVSDDKGVSPIDDASERIDMADAFLPDDLVSEAAPAEDVPVSPFGFGPYPEVPADYPIPPTWEREGYNTFSPDTQRELELLDRVLIQLWQQGERGFLGGSTDNGKVYPHYKNTAYVRYERTESGRRYIARYKGDPAIRISPEQLRTGDLPSHIRVLDMDSEGIDPYQFLNLK